MSPNYHLFQKYRLLIPVLLITTLWSACSPTAKLKNLPSVKSFETEIAKFDSLTNAEDYPSDAILFTGSSSIRLWKTIREDMLPYPVIQRGFGGAKIEDMAYYLHRIVYPLNFRAIVFFAGTNNLTGSGKEMPEDSIVYWINNINHQVRRKYPVAPIFWIAITPVNSRIKVMDKVFAMNKQVKSICEENKNMYFIDTEKVFLGADGNPRSELFINDQLHLNREGYVLWSTIIKYELDKHLVK
jgi:lysophospholipase L1-like esterase